MTDINVLFFELIRIAIGNQASFSHKPSAEEWGELYAMAKKQSLVGIGFAGLQKTLSKSNSLAIPKFLYLEWMGMAATIQLRNEVVNKQCVHLQQTLKDVGVENSILKGQGVAGLYAEHLRGLRQPGDIDVYVNCGREKALEYARSIQDEVEWDYKHLHLNIFPDTDIELHYVPEVLMDLWKNRKLQRWFIEPSVQSKIFVNTGEFVTPSPEFNLFYILLHIYRHFFFEGIGLRQLMDYYWVLHNSSLDWEDLQCAKKLISEFGMMRFSSGVMWIMNYVFGLEERCLIGGMDEAEGRYILNEVMAGGNFGHYDRRIENGVDGKAGSVLRVLKHNMHLLIRYPGCALWSPIYFMWHYGWKMLRS